MSMDLFPSLAERSLVQVSFDTSAGSDFLTNRQSCPLFCTSISKAASRSLTRKRRHTLLSTSGKPNIGRRASPWFAYCCVSAANWDPCWNLPNMQIWNENREFCGGPDRRRSGPPHPDRFVSNFNTLSPSEWG